MVGEGAENLACIPRGYYACDRLAAKKLGDVMEFDIGQGS